MKLCDNFLGIHRGWHLVTRFPVLILNSKGKLVPLSEIQRRYTHPSDELYRKGWFQDQVDKGLYLDRGEFVHYIKIDKRGNVVIGPVHSATQKKAGAIQKVSATLRKL